MINFKNLDSIKQTTGLSRGELFSQKDLDLFYFGDRKQDVEFGNLKNDIEFSVYDMEDNLLHWQNLGMPANEVLNPVTEDFQKVVLRPGNHLRNAGFIRGQYRIVYNIFRNVLGNSYSRKLFIDEISPSRREIRLLPAKSGEPVSDATNVDQFEQFANAATDVNKRLFFGKLLLNFGQNKFYPVVNWVKDDRTFPEAPYSIIIKLYEPIPNDVEENDKCWLSVEQSPSVVDKVFLFGPETERIRGRLLKPANFNIDIANLGGRQTPFENWNDILSTNTTTSEKLIDQYLSSSIEGMDLNIDFSDFTNFVRFGSAKERLANFKYKLELIEDYNTRISNLQAQSSSISPASASVQFDNDIINFQQKKRQVIADFDSYERYLYYESGSEYSGSVFGREDEKQFHAIGNWPKTTSTLPYTLAHTTSSVAVNWYATQSAIATLYDQQNPNRLIAQTPTHIQVDVNNEQYLTFLDAVGQYFDTFYVYIDGLAKLHNRDESIFEGLSKDLTFHVAKSMGFDVFNGNDYVELWKYAIGTDETGSYAQTGSIHSQPYENLTKEIWRRILNNMPYLLKTKGTARSIKALLACYGIPSSMLIIREYGGPDPLEYPNMQDKSAYVFDDFVYSLNFSGSYVSTDWIDYSGSSGKPNTLEFRFKTKDDTRATQHLISVDSAWGVTLVRTSNIVRENRLGYVQFSLGGNLATSSQFSFYDGNFYSVILRQTGSNHELFVKRSEYGRMLYESSASIAADADYELDGTLYIGGAPSNTFGLKSSASFQEFRAFSSSLNISVIDNHVRWPKSYNANELTSSYSDLLLRYSFDEPKNHSSDAVVSDVKANQTNTFPGTAVGFPDRINYTAETEEFYALTPNLGLARLYNNKIRFDDNVLERGLSPYYRAEKSMFDKAPLDSNRLGVFFSPVDTYNRDIIATFAGSDLTSLVGDPNDYYEDRYQDLEVVNDFYWSKYTSQKDFNAFLRVLRRYDQSFFEQIRQLLPARVNATVGVLIEPHILERHKYKHRRITWEQLEKNAEVSQSDPFTLSAEKILKEGEISSPLSLLAEKPVYDVTLNTGLFSASFSSSIINPILPTVEYVSTSSYYRGYFESNFFSRTKYDGTINTKLTTLDGKDPVEVTFTNPNKLFSTDSGPSKLRVE